MRKHLQSRSTAAATAPIALIAVAQHLANHQLPATTLEAPRTQLGETAVLVYIDRGDLDTWTETLAVVDSIETTPSLISPDFERVVVTGRITSPIGLVPIAVRAYQPTRGRILKAVRS